MIVDVVDLDNLGMIPFVLVVDVVDSDNLGMIRFCVQQTP